MHEASKLLILAGIAVAICFVIGSIDAPPPDVSAFARTTEEPADEDNAYCGFVAAELYRRKTGRRPESIDALVPEFLPSVPTDPFDHGAALKYDVERGVVWTVGPDRDFTGDIQSGKKSYGRNRKYVVNLDGSEVK